MSKKDVIEKYAANENILAQRILKAFEKSDFETIADVEKIVGREKVRAILDGVIQHPRYDTIKAISEALNVSPAYLVGGEK